jgi:uncharacterized protein
MEMIGRVNEKKILQEALKSSSAELIAVYGRRRVGKTYLIRSVYEKELCFVLSGLHHASTANQLMNFSRVLAEANKSRKKNLPPANWFEAFEELKKYITSIRRKQKKVIFLDELPWLDSHKSNFLSALDNFWNGWASLQKDIVVVLCGSAASWMIKKILNSKGGLHNRVTKRIRLLPFTLAETKEYFLHKKNPLQPHAICQLYMVMGGIPFYLNEVKRGESVAQSINRICFSKDGLLASEFENLYSALFENSDKHIKIIKALAAVNKGINRNELIKKAKLLSGGGLSELLGELVESGFVTEVPAPATKAKHTLYRLTDEYSLFYLKFIQPNKSLTDIVWQSIDSSAVYTSWCGYAFENICLKQIGAIKAALGISGVLVKVYSWQGRHAQIDLIIDRADGCINICEMKFYNTEFEISRSYAKNLEQQIVQFKSLNPIRKTHFLTFITSYGLKDNTYKNSMVEHSLTLEDLFKG